MTVSTLFALVYGEIAHAIREGIAPLSCLETATLGQEDHPADKPATLLHAKDGSVYRLTLERVR